MKQPAETHAMHAHSDHHAEHDKHAGHSIAIYRDVPAQILDRALAHDSYPSMGTHAAAGTSVYGSAFSRCDVDTAYFWNDSFPLWRVGVHSRSDTRT